MSLALLRKVTCKYDQGQCFLTYNFGLLYWHCVVFISFAGHSNMTGGCNDVSGLPLRCRWFLVQYPRPSSLNLLAVCLSGWVYGGHIRSCCYGLGLTFRTWGVTTAPTVAAVVSGLGSFLTHLCENGRARDSLVVEQQRRRCPHIVFACDFLCLVLVRFSGSFRSDVVSLCFRSFPQALFFFVC